MPNGALEDEASGINPGGGGAEVGGSMENGGMPRPNGNARWLAAVALGGGRGGRLDGNACVAGAAPAGMPIAALMGADDENMRASSAAVSGDCTARGSGAKPPLTYTGAAAEAAGSGGDANDNPGGSGKLVTGRPRPLYPDSGSPSMPLLRPRLVAAAVVAAAGGADVIMAAEAAAPPPTAAAATAAMCAARAAAMAAHGLPMGNPGDAAGAVSPDEVGGVPPAAAAAAAAAAA